MSASSVMSAFALFGFEPALELDESELKSRFEHLRTQFHPDRFSHGSALERRLAMQRAADINAAYATLSKPLLRAQLYFELRGITLSEARSMDDAAFLMQQMELREALEEAHDTQTRQKLRQQIQQLWSQSWQALCPTSIEAQADASLIQRELQRLQFLQRFLEQMD
ncbi:MAG: Fe-S protein assembly co-chaperone HscB [Gammaproteobacteria bacterium 28-57-27]|nr:MAG: Fe-S protein assembly co-chaperone HscB [Gammaproteobacteria bacterium 28-57-27]